MLKDRIRSVLLAGPWKEKKKETLVLVSKFAKCFNSVLVFSEAVATTFLGYFSITVQDEGEGVQKLLFALLCVCWHSTCAAFARFS